jgi:membrane peptidoglycan carboxypeptidase
VAGVHFVTKIESADGNVLFRRSKAAPLEKVCDAPAAWMTHHCMEEVMEIGTASNAASLGLNPMPVAGKTGTHLNSTDLWFAGYTSKVTCAVWVGVDKKDRVYPDAFSRDTALPIWVDIMNASVSRFEPTPFQPPAGVTTAELCALSGQLATDACLERGPDPDAPERTKLFKCSYLEYIRPEVKVEKICGLHTGEVKETDEEGIESFSSEEEDTPIPSAAPVGVNLAQANADARPIRVRGRVVLGTDPYKSYVGAEQGETTVKPTAGPLPMSNPFEAPIIPTAPLPTALQTDGPVVASPGKAVVD